MNRRLKKRFYIGNILLLASALICLVCYDIFGGLWLKGLTSSWFVVLGLFNLLYARKNHRQLRSFQCFVLLGLIFGACADVLLGVQFIFGILFFAMGHIFYLIAFCSLERISLRDVWITLPIAFISLFLVAGTPFIRIEDPFMKKLLLGYAVIIACMLGKGISNAITKRSLSRYLVLAGCILFWFSDLILAIDMFGQASRLTWILCSYTYWPAQNILAFSLYHFANENRH